MTRSGSSRLLPVVITGTAVLCLLCGCAANRDTGAAPSASELPNWVRVVPRTADGKAFYVGGCSAAESAEAGVAKAEADALSQIEAEARKHFREIIMAARRGSDIEVTSTNQAKLWGAGGDLLSQKLLESATREQVYHEECGGPGSGAACRIFVLLTVDLELWDATVIKALEALGANAREERRPEIGQLAEFAARHYERKARAKP